MRWRGENVILLSCALLIDIWNAFHGHSICQIRSEFVDIFDGKYVICGNPFLTQF